MLSLILSIALAIISLIIVILTFRAFADLRAIRKSLSLVDFKFVLKRANTAYEAGNKNEAIYLLRLAKQLNSENVIGADAKTREDAMRFNMDLDRKIKTLTDAQ